MNKVKFQIQVMKAVLNIKRKQYKKMNAGPKKRALLANISKAQKMVEQYVRAQQALKR